MEMPKNYDPKKLEEKWQREWEKTDIYKFKPDLSPKYFIDTPPPYPTGELHLGHTLNWVYIDLVARYKRMRGYNVLFPQGWDCHGLPTEVKVEETYGIRKRDISRGEFRKLCIEFTQENIVRMKDQMNKLGFSIDWNYEYITMNPDYVRRSQLSFIELYKKGLIYRGNHPVNWCPRCETAIAYAEVEYEEKEGLMSYISFSRENGEYVTIATTRPELLPSCVAAAINPFDERYKDLVGKNLIVPIFEQKVKVIADEDVDPDFGTGIVMICTFGDKADVRWMKRHKLDIVMSIDEQGKMTGHAKEYQGMDIDECKKKIVEDLENMDLLKRKEEVEQNVGVCWRCKTPVEILAREQWFANISKLKKRMTEVTNSIVWVPDHMRHRLIEWIESMEWDWVISRQRIFATPIPVWLCRDCDYVLLALEKKLPVDPIQDSPHFDSCPNCNSKLIPEEDVLDTWWDSSQSALNVAGWPEINEKFKKLYPADLQPNGHDIIRTWDFYLMWKSIALLDATQYETVLINGMIYGEDGRKMSKSRGNIVLPDDIMNKMGADVVRQWASNSIPGSDIQFMWKDANYAFRFLQKMWNVCRFALLHLENYTPEEDVSYRVVDRWILNEMNFLIEKVTDEMEAYRFGPALQEIVKFAWHVFADHYIEMIKYRLYSEDEYKISAQNTLYLVLLNILKLLSPFIPHFTDEVYHYLPHARGSIHEEKWPEYEEIDEKIIEDGNVVKEVIASLRRYKSEDGIPLNVYLKKAIIFTKDENYYDIISKTISDILGTIKIKEISVIHGEPHFETIPTKIKPILSKIGPKYKEKAKEIIDNLSMKDPIFIKKEIDEKGFLEISGEKITPDLLEFDMKKTTKEGDLIEEADCNIKDLLVYVER